MHTLKAITWNNRLTGARQGAILAAVLSLATLPDAAASPALDVGSRKQLFVDHKFIETAEGVELVMNPAVRTGEVLIAPEAPWEKDLEIFSYNSVIKEDDGRVRIWYGLRTRPDRRKFLGLAYAESTDGIHFTKPVLNLVEFAGSKENNFVLPTDPGVMMVGGGSVIKDANPAAPPSQRYKSWVKVYPTQRTGHAEQHRVFTSADGIHWKTSERPVTGLRAADTQPTWFWDPRIQRYAGYSREWVQFPGERKIRMVSYNESDDLHTWEKSFIALEADELDGTASLRPIVDFGTMTMDGHTIIARPDPDTPAANIPGTSAQIGPDGVSLAGGPADIYGPGVVPYLEADGVYLALMSMFYHWDVDGFPETSDVRLGVSRDGRHFTKPGGRRPFIGVGPAGAPDSKWLWWMPSPIRMGDELWLYYFGTNRTHSFETDPEAKPDTKNTIITRAVMRLDGFVSADFDYAGGTVITPPLRFTGSRLELNLDTGAGGVGRVEILDESGAPIPGFTLREADQLNANNVRTLVTWRGKSEVSALAGKTVRLHLKMRSAKLYAFQFR